MHLNVCRFKCKLHLDAKGLWPKLAKIEEEMPADKARNMELLKRQIIYEFVCVDFKLTTYSVDIKPI